MRENPEAARHEDERDRLRLRELLNLAESSPRPVATLLSAWDALSRREYEVMPELFALLALRRYPLTGYPKCIVAFSRTIM